MHTLTDTAELAAELSAVDGVPLAEAQTLAAAHLGHITREAGRAPQAGRLSEAQAQALLDAANGSHDADDIYALLRVLRDGGWRSTMDAESKLFSLDPPADDSDDTRGQQPTGWCYICGCAAWRWDEHGPLCPHHANVLDEHQANTPAQVNISDRVRCSYCTGEHADAECPLRRMVFVARDPADMPLRFRASELGADIVDWGQRGYVLLTDEGDVTISAGELLLSLSLAQARALRSLLALPQVRSLLLA